jgi:hypothetical protein
MSDTWSKHLELLKIFLSSSQSSGSLSSESSVVPASSAADDSFQSSSPVSGEACRSVIQPRGQSRETRFSESPVPESTVQPPTVIPSTYPEECSSPIASSCSHNTTEAAEILHGFRSATQLSQMALENHARNPTKQSVPQTSDQTPISTDATIIVPEDATKLNLAVVLANQFQTADKIRRVEIRNIAREKKVSQEFQKLVGFRQQLQAKTKQNQGRV